MNDDKAPRLTYIQDDLLEILRDGRWTPKPTLMEALPIQSRNRFNLHNHLTRLRRKLEKSGMTVSFRLLYGKSHFRLSRYSSKKREDI